MYTLPLQLDTHQLHTFSTTLQLPPPFPSPPPRTSPRPRAAPLVSGAATAHASMPWGNFLPLEMNQAQQTRGLLPSLVALQDPALSAKRRTSPSERGCEAETTMQGGWAWAWGNGGGVRTGLQTMSCFCHFGRHRQTQKNTPAINVYLPGMCLVSQN